MDNAERATPGKLGAPEGAVWMVETFTGPDGSAVTSPADAVGVRVSFFDESESLLSTMHGSFVR